MSVLEATINMGKINVNDKTKNRRKENMSLITLCQYCGLVSHTIIDFTR